MELKFETLVEEVRDANYSWTDEPFGPDYEVCSSYYILPQMETSLYYNYVIENFSSLLFMP